MWPLACQVPGAEHGKCFVSHGWFGRERTEQKKLPGLIWHGMSPGIWGKVPLDTQGLQMVQPIHCTWLSVDKTRTKQAKKAEEPKLSHFVEAELKGSLEMKCFHTG